jgi:hypothetical protein
VAAFAAVMVSATAKTSAVVCKAFMVPSDLDGCGAVEFMALKCHYGTTVT